jgi:hypothetical protein
MQCQLIIGYRGLEKLAWQSGEVESIDAEVVCKNDTFIFRKGTEVHSSSGRRAWTATAASRRRLRVREAQERRQARPVPAEVRHREDPQLR